MAAGIALSATPASPTWGQSGPPPTTANVVRLDVLSPFVLNMGYNLFANRAFVFPVLVSYERRVGNRWSLGFEGLVNGGVPDEKLVGATLSARCYLRRDASLSGLYAAPQLAYRRVSSTEILNNTIVPNPVHTNDIGLIFYRACWNKGSPMRRSLVRPTGGIY